MILIGSHLAFALLFALSWSGGSFAQGPSLHAQAPSDTFSNRASQPDSVIEQDHAEKIVAQVEKILSQKEASESASLGEPSSRSKITDKDTLFVKVLSEENPSYEEIIQFVNQSSDHRQQVHNTLEKLIEHVSKSDTPSKTTDSKESDEFNSQNEIRNRVYQLTQALYEKAFIDSPSEIAELDPPSNPVGIEEAKEQGLENLSPNQNGKSLSRMLDDISTGQAGIESRAFASNEKPVSQTQATLPQKTKTVPPSISKPLSPINQTTTPNQTSPPPKDSAQLALPLSPLSLPSNTTIFDPDFFNSKPGIGAGLTAQPSQLADKRSSLPKTDRVTPKKQREINPQSTQNEVAQISQLVPPKVETLPSSSQRIVQNPSPSRVEEKDFTNDFFSKTTLPTPPLLANMALVGGEDLNSYIFPQNQLPVMEEEPQGRPLASRSLTSPKEEPLNPLGPENQVPPTNVVALEPENGLETPLPQSPLVFSPPSPSSTDLSSFLAFVSAMD